MKMKNNDIFLL